MKLNDNIRSSKRLKILIIGIIFAALLIALALILITAGSGGDSAQTTQATSVFTADETTAQTSVETTFVSDTSAATESTSALTQTTSAATSTLFPGTTAGPTTANLPPEALGDPIGLAANEQTALTIRAETIAYDPENRQLSIVGASWPVHGTAVLSTDSAGNGVLVYTSNDITENVSEFMTLTVTDGWDSAEVNIRIDISKWDFTPIFTPTLLGVSLSGDAYVHNTLSVFLYQYSTAPASTPSFTYRWMSAATQNGQYTDIPGAVGGSLNITGDLLGKYIKLKVTASGSAGGTAYSVAAGPVGTGFSSGDGTPGNPYVITNKAQLLRLSAIPTSGLYFSLGSDIVLGPNEYITGSFNGSFNGNFKKVTMNISTSDGTSNIGLFSSLSAPAYVCNLVVDGTIMTVSSNVGGIAGSSFGTIEKCFVDAYIRANNYVGGITGINHGIIGMCGVLANSYVSGTNRIGGIAGLGSAGSEIINSYSHGDLRAENGAAGGLVCVNNGRAEYCYSTGLVSATTGTGGLVYSNGGTVTSSYYDSTTSLCSDTGKGIPKTTSEMLNQFTYSGWNFTTVWYITPDYPKLRLQ